MKILLTTLFISITFNSSAIAQWSEVFLPRTDTLAPLVAVEWPDSATGYVFDVRGYYYKTTNEGVSWIKDSLRPMPFNDIKLQPYKGLTVRSVDFITPQVGITTLSIPSLPDLDSVIYCTTDGGLNWKKKEINLKNHSKWGSYTAEYNQIRMKSPTHWYLHYMMEDFEKWYGAELLLFSDDMGDSWKEISADTLVSVDLVSAQGFITIDSLHHYKFYHWHNVDGDNSWVKMTADGGKTWVRIQDPSHPLAEQYYRGLAFEKIHTVSDTGISITMIADNDYPPGRHYGISTKDIRYRDTKQGWTSFALPWFGAATLDILYQDEMVYTVTNSSGPFGYTDSTWIVNAPVGSIKGIRSPLPLLDIVASSRDVLWARSSGGQKLYRLDRRLVSVRYPRVQPSDGSLQIYPNPINRGIEKAFTIEHQFTQKIDYLNITIYDLLGRELWREVETDVRLGRYSKTISLSSIIRNYIPNCAIVTLSSNNQLPISTMLFMTR